MAPKSFYKKTILTEGFGGLPGDESDCKISILNCFEDSFFLLSSWIKKTGQCNIVIGEADCVLDYGVEYAVRNMKRGEMSEVELKMDNLISKIIIKLIEFSPSISFCKLSNLQKLERAQRHKENGNKLFKSSNIKEAFYRFSRSIKYTIPLRSKDATSEEVNNLYLSLCNNMALCQLLAGNFERTVDLCDKVLGISQVNVKALLRRADALIELKKFDKAAVDLKKIVEIEPANNRALMKLTFVDSQLKNQEKTYINMVKRMFPLT